MNKERFSESIRKLIILPEGTVSQYNNFRLSPLITHTAIHLFPYIFYWLPDLAKELCNDLLKSGDETKELIGAWLVFYESYRNDNFIEKADSLSSSSITHRRLMAGVAADVITWADNRNRADVILRKLFYDEDAQVRSQAAEVFRSIEPAEFEPVRELANCFLKSPAFDENSFTFLKMLEDTTCDVLDLILEASHQMITRIVKSGKQYGKHGDNVHMLQDLLKREYSSSESDMIARRKILDLIDLMLLHDIYGVDRIITTHDR